MRLAASCVSGLTVHLSLLSLAPQYFSLPATTRHVNLTPAASIRRESFIRTLYLIFLSLRSGLSRAKMPLRLDINRRLTARSDRVKSCDLHPTEQWMLVSLYNGNVHIWNHESQQLVKSFEVCDLPVRAAIFVPRKNWVVTGSDDMQVSSRGGQIGKSDINNLCPRSESSTTTHWRDSIASMPTPTM